MYDLVSCVTEFILIFSQTTGHPESKSVKYIPLGEGDVMPPLKITSPHIFKVPSRRKLGFLSLRRLIKHTHIHTHILSIKFLYFISHMYESLVPITVENNSMEPLNSKVCFKMYFV